MIRALKNIFSRRNLAVSDVYRSTLPNPIYTTWSVQKAVKDGYKANGWVYRAITLITKSAASVPWKVFNSDDEPVDGHHLARLFERPNPHISRQDLFELVTAWLELAGNSYLHRVQTGGRTVELWPISPDRLRPIPGASLDEWLRGYALDHRKEVAYTPEQIIHHRFLDPSNPLLGISPLEVAGKTVDLDNAQRDFNVSTSQNRGVIDGVFTFDRQFSSMDDAEAVAQKIEEKHGKKRGFLVLGSNAKYERLALSPAEMDFQSSRQWNREEICNIFGIPLPLISQERATYSNYATAELIFWTMTVIPLLDDLADTFNFQLDDELAEGERIGVDLTTVGAIRRAMLDRAKTAQMLHDMGVPFSSINRLFEFGVDEFEGWDQSLPKKSDSGAAEEERKAPQDSPRRFRLDDRSFELRAIADDIEKAAQGQMRADFESLLEKQQERVFDAIRKGATSGFAGLIAADQENWIETMRGHFMSQGRKFGAQVVVEKRAIDDALTQALMDYLDHETFLLTEKSRIDETTVDAILTQIQAGIAEGWATGQIQQAIIDTGIFGPDRALRLARTLAGSAASVGQYEAARMSGATHKIWEASSGARPEHADRDGERVEINERFSPKFGATVGPRWPLDPYLPPADRVNCRCSMRFDAEE